MFCWVSDGLPVSSTAQRGCANTTQTPSRVPAVSARLVVKSSALLPYSVEASSLPALEVDMNPDGHSASSIRPHLFDEVGGSQLSGVVSLPPVAVPSGNPRTDAVAALDLPLSMRGLGDPRLGTVRDDLLSLPWNPDQQIVPRIQHPPAVCRDGRRHAPQAATRKGISLNNFRAEPSVGVTGVIPLTSCLVVELPGIEPDPINGMTCGNTGFDYAKRRETTCGYTERC